MAYKEQDTAYVAATTSAKIFDVPSTVAKKEIKSLTLTNKNSGAETVDLVIIRASGTKTLDSVLLLDYSLAAGAAYDVACKGKVLYPGDAVWGNTTTGSKVECDWQLGNILK